MFEDINIKENNASIHLIGIGGVSMSAIAKILVHKGFNVSGSDMKSSKSTESLQKDGIKVYIGHREANVKNKDLVIYTAAIDLSNNPEIIGAKNFDIPMISRAEILGMIMKSYDNSIAIAGTHGKTTSTSMISLIMNETDYDPTIMIGGNLKEINGNLKIGSDKVLIAEACEYKESFTKFFPTIGVILNIDEDHLDYFTDIDHIISAFIKFSKLIPKDGFLVANNDDYNVKKIYSHVDCNVVTIGINIDSEYQGKNITYNDQGYPVFDVYHNNELLERFTLSVPGIHNIYNSLSSIAIAHKMNIPVEYIKERLYSFKGTDRRFDILGDYNGIAKVVDDYAHHPNAIKASLQAANKMSHNRIWTIFQPHTFTRTKALLLDFAKSFNESDKIIITDIYAAREIDTGEIHSRDLVKQLQLEGIDALYISSFEDIKEHIKSNVEKNDIVITMGAGNIYEIGYDLVEDASVATS